MHRPVTQVTHVTLTQDAQSVTLDAALGTVRALSLAHGGRRLDPLHRAPWLEEAAVQDDGSLLPVERGLSGDFLCLPFGSDGRAAPPTHGWTANAPWDVVSQVGHLHLRQPLRFAGASVDKRVRLAPGAPLLVQEHRIAGGAGATTVAHHPMVRVRGGGRMSVSPKRVALTPGAPLEPDAHVLAYPAHSADVAAMPGIGGPVDLTRLPIGTGHEDFVTLVEAEDSPLGWTALVREAEDDVVFVLKDPAVLPVTMLWFSNGGRRHAPWNGRHLGVVGIEDGCAAGAGGLTVAMGPNPVQAAGVRTYLALAPLRTHVIRHVIGAIARPPGWVTVQDIAVQQDQLVLTGNAGGPVALPFDPAWLLG